MKILLLKPSSLGDVIHAIPVARLLKIHFPHATLHWWLGIELLPLLEQDPDVDRLIPFDRKRFLKPSNWLRTLRTLRELRAESYDWVIDLQGLARSALLAWMAHGKMTVGVEDFREGAPLFHDRTVPRPGYYSHAVDWYLEVLKHLRVPVHHHFQWLPERPEISGPIRSEWGNEGRRWVVINPGARWDNKRWPAAYYADLVRRLAYRHPDLWFAVLGGKDDQERGRRITEEIPDRCVDLTGRTSLPELIEWIRMGSLIVTNDTGPMHIAAAMNKPMVALFGPTEPRRTGPYGQLDQVLQLKLPCEPCMKPVCRWKHPLECLTALHVDQVMHAAEKILHRGQPVA